MEVRVLSSAFGPAALARGDGGDPRSPANAGAGGRRRAGPAPARLALLPTLCLLAALLAGCVNARGGAVAETGPCAQTIPLATQQAGGGAQLVAVRSLTRRKVQSLLADTLPQGAARPGRPLPPRSCVLVYRGRFAAAPGSPPRSHLVLVIAVRRPAVLARLAVDRLPPALRRAS